jgi:ABC-2 type transport system permease protein
MIALPIAIAVLAVAFILRRSMRGRTGHDPAVRLPHRSGILANTSSTIALVASREISLRLRGRTFRVATGVMLLAIAAVIVIPTLGGSGGAHERVGLTGHGSRAVASAARTTGKQVGATVETINVANASAAESLVRSGDLDLAVVDGRTILVTRTFTSGDRSTKAQLTRALALVIGEQRAFGSADLTPDQIHAISHIQPIPIRGLSSSKSTSSEQSTSAVGLILLFVLLSQYGTWTLIGVMEEKASRVVEVLLAAIRPTQLLAGKVLGIGALAFGQASVLVGFALGLGAAVGSDVLKGTAPTVVVATLGWLVIGYAFYSWVFAAAGSMVERQDQVQALAFPITIPLLVGYISSITAVTSAHASLYVTILAYIPLTAPFGMPVLVALHAVTWWEFLLSVLTSAAATYGMARLAGIVYRRAVLRTGRRVPLREVLAIREPSRSR